MKKIVTLACLIVIIISTVRAQDASPEIQIPSSPALNIIGVQSAEISKPGNYAGVYANLIAPILSNNGTIPTDLAVEVSPFYLEARNITWKELEKINPYRDLRISVASNSVIDSTALVFSRLGIGFRTNLLTGKINNIDGRKIKLSTLNDINTTYNNINRAQYGTIDTANVDSITRHITDKILKKRVQRIIVDNKTNKDRLLEELDILLDELNKKLKPNGSIYDYSLRTGSFLEIAGAFAIDFPKNTINFSEINRWGIWINYTYRPRSKNQAIDIGAIARISNFSFDPTIVFDGGSIFGDLGISINWHIPTTKLIVSGEFVGKAGMSDIKSSDADHQFTFTGVTESKWNTAVGYQITPNTLLSISFSDIAGNSDYLQDNTMQFLMCLSAALAPMKK